MNPVFKPSPTGPLSKKVMRFRALFAVLVGALLSFILPFLSGIPLLGVRRRFGRVSYLSLCAFVASGIYLLGFWQESLSFLLFCALVFIFVEFLESGLKFLSSLVLASIFNLGLFATFLGLWFGFKELSFVGEAKAWFEGQLAPIIKMNPEVQVDAAWLLSQLPSMLLILFVLTLWIASLFEGRMRIWLGSRVVVQAVLTRFKVPEPMVWVSILAMAGAFIEYDIFWLKAVCSNAFNLLFFVYFVQGLYVLMAFFSKYKVGFFWQLLCYFLIAQFFFLVSLLGFMEFWFGFEKRLNSKNT